MKLEEMENEIEELGSERREWEELDLDWDERWEYAFESITQLDTPFRRRVPSD